MPLPSRVPGYVKCTLAPYQMNENLSSEIRPIIVPVRAKHNYNLVRGRLAPPIAHANSPRQGRARPNSADPFRILVPTFTFFLV